MLQTDQLFVDLRRMSFLVTESHYSFGRATIQVKCNAKIGWPWIIQGGIAGIGLVLGCIYCGVEWQAGGTFLGLAFTFFLVGLAPLMLMLNSLIRLILR